MMEFALLLDVKKRQPPKWVTAIGCRVYAPKTTLAAITAVVLRSVVFTLILKNTGKEIFMYFFHFI